MTLDGAPVRPRDKVAVDQTLVLKVVQEAEVFWAGEDMPLEIIYEDADLMVINKPAGLVVHPAAGHASGTLVNALLNYAPELARLPRGGIVHRLDKDTSVAPSVHRWVAMPMRVQKWLSSIMANPPSPTIG